MLYKKPKNDDKYQWTNHVVGKMAYYGISESLVKRVVRFPKRVEAGIAPGTTACMQPAGSKKRPAEVWVMYVEIGEKISRDKKQEIRNKKKNASLSSLSLVSPRKRIITAWRYPGISPIGKPIPIPEDILAEIEEI